MEERRLYSAYHGNRYSTSRKRRKPSARSTPYWHHAYRLALLRRLRSGRRPRAVTSSAGRLWLTMSREAMV